MAEDYDPLNIGVVQSSNTEELPPPTVRVIPRTTMQVDLFEVIEEPKRRRRSMKSLNIDKEMLFGRSEAPDSNFIQDFLQFKSKLYNSNSESDLINIEKEDFTQYMDKESVSNKFSNPSDTLKKTRLSLLNSDYVSIQKRVKELKAELNLHVLQKTEIEKNLKTLSDQMNAIYHSGIEQNRNKAAIAAIHIRKSLRLHDVYAEIMRSNIARCGKYIDWLRDLPVEYPCVPTLITDKFLETLIMKNEKTQKIEKQIAILEKQLKPITPTKAGSGDWYENVLHPKSKTGEIIKRFEEKISELRFSDVFEILEHLAEIEGNYSEFEDLLFDIAWSRVQYPFGISRVIKLPPVKDLFPAAFAKIEMPEEYTLASFNMLNGMDWPFKTVVDLLFSMMILTNPFDIAHVFWDVIQEAAKCMNKQLVVFKGVAPEDVEIDFDSLFPVLLISILTFGIDEWMQVALYTMSFNEFVHDDPQLQFAMTYLEGLVTQMLSIDMNKVKQKAHQIRDNWIEESVDPLGVSGN